MSEESIKDSKETETETAPPEEEIKRKKSATVDNDNTTSAESTEKPEKKQNVSEKATSSQEDKSENEETQPEKETEDIAPKEETEIGAEEEIKAEIEAEIEAEAEEEIEAEVEEEKEAETEEEEQELDIEEKFSQLNDKYVRLLAEFENFKRRATQEMQSRFKFATQSLALNIITGLDNLERAIDQARDENENEQLKEFLTGIEMVQQQFFEAFEKNNIERIDPTGEPFDPNKHEAMGVVETDDVQPDHIAMVFQPGYMLHDRVIRPAMVQVAKKIK